MKPENKLCATCNGELNADRQSRYCSLCGTARRAFSRYGSGRTYASSAVATAIRNGEITKAAGQDCTDCGGAATEYDHRDYNRPLQIDAVCRGCNRRRLSAIPKAWTFEEFLAWRAGIKSRLLSMIDPSVMCRMRLNHFTNEDRPIHPLQTKGAPKVPDEKEA